jgi:hypothetical protein
MNNKLTIVLQRGMCLAVAFVRRGLEKAHQDEAVDLNFFTLPHNLH